MIKRIFDMGSSFTLLVLFAPFFLLIALLIKLDSPGPVFFIQERLGKDGKVFRMFKFRSMIANAAEVVQSESATAAPTKMSGSVEIPAELFCFEDDPRITKTGKFLRKTSLDEIPQLINVILGDMSLVGPRPPVTNELGPYSNLSDIMKIRFRVKPGITGLAQVSGRNDLDWDTKILYDNIYVEKYLKHGIIEDVVILAKTFLVVVSMKDITEKKMEI
jgi:lipopolysaccharide/colanic/teichoic acid biosynthesis glycosyltransferase